MTDDRAEVIRCPHATECPGCPLIRLPYPEQLEEKRHRVLRAMAAHRELASLDVAPTVAADPIAGYRTRAKLVVGQGKIGLFAGRSHEVVDLPECRVLAPPLAAVARAIRGALPLPVPLRALDLRQVDGGALVTLVVPEGVTERAVQEAVDRVSSLTTHMVGIAVAYRAEDSHRVLGRAPVRVRGEEKVRVAPPGARSFHYVAPGTFAQAHAGQERALVGAVSDLVRECASAAKPPRVLDLFSGVGVLALELAAEGARVLAVEAYEPSARLCREAATAQSLDVTVEVADAGTIVERLVGKGERIDLVVVNPPRRGLSPGLRRELVRLDPTVLVYVSCEPASLARDLSDLVRQGRAVSRVAPYDMMPLSGEVETLAVLCRGAGLPAPVVLYEDEQLIAVDKPPHEPTTPQGEHDTSLLQRVRAREGTAHAVPVHRLDIGTSGVCLFAREPEYIPALAVALAEAEKEYLALVRGIVRDRGSVRRPLVERSRPHEARTRYVRREIVGGHSLVVARPDEGHKHQIRRHMSSIGHAIIGDERYGHPPTNQHFSQRHFLDRTFLHCARIALSHGGGTLELSSPLPADLASVLDGLRAPEGGQRGDEES